MIVSTSDDRSVKLWSIDDKNIDNDEKYWSNVKISLKCSLFGHTARVMRNKITEDYIISVGEDAIMCIWKTNGDLIRKQKLYQDGCLWSLDCNKHNNIIVTGSSNSGVMIHRLISDLNNTNDQIKELYFSGSASTAKCVAISARKNIISLTEQGELMYFDKETSQWHLYSADNIKPCSMILSVCRQYIALTDLNGLLVIFAEVCKFEPKLIHCLTQKISDGRISSLIWLSDRNICVCDKNGVITIWNSHGGHCEKSNEFYLPSCKERWLTVAAIIPNINNALIIGDRCGNIHLYEKNSIHPVQTLSKVHGRLGSNFIKVENDKVITVGRDSSVKFFIVSVDKNNGKPYLHFLYYVKLPFNWIDRFIGKTDHLLCGFRETDFIIWDLLENQQLFEIKCGGGHRSWDILKKWEKCDGELNEYTLEFVFIKNSIINVFEIKNSDISKCFVDAFHVKEINALKVIKHDDQKFSILSAGEDTCLLFNQCKIDNENVIFNNQLKISKHLSSVRCLCIYDLQEKYIIFSAGGRAQICAWELCKPAHSYFFNCKELSQHLIKGTDIDKKGDKGWRQVEMNSDAETRFMSLACLDSSHFPHIQSTYNNIVLFSGCSDGYLRVYLFTDKFELLKSCHFNSKCILNVHVIIFKSHPIVFTMSTEGVISIWDFNSLGDVDIFQPVYQKQYHKAGINSFDVKNIHDNKFLIATGGDDNDVQLNIVSLSMKNDYDSLSIEEVCKWHCDKYHSSQITEIKILNNNYIISASIDQRVTLLKMIYNESCEKNLDCKYIGQYHTNISDVQGMTILNDTRYDLLTLNMIII